jgi:hypothetical protein
MDFRVFVIIEIPILDKKYDLFVPIDRRIHDIIKSIKESDKELTRGYYKDRKLNLYNKSNGQLYDLNMIIKNSNIKMGTRLILM